MFHINLNKECNHLLSYSVLASYIVVYNYCLTIINTSRFTFINMEKLCILYEIFLCILLTLSGFGGVDGNF